MAPDAGKDIEASREVLMPVMTAHDIQRMIDGLAPKALAALQGKDFLLTWDKGRDELEAIFRLSLIHI